MAMNLGKLLIILTVSVNITDVLSLGMDEEEARPHKTVLWDSIFRRIPVLGNVEPGPRYAVDDGFSKMSTSQLGADRDDIKLRFPCIYCQLFVTFIATVKSDERISEMMRAISELICVLWSPADSMNDCVDYAQQKTSLLHSMINGFMVECGTVCDGEGADEQLAVLGRMLQEVNRASQEVPTTEKPDIASLAIN
ncbi:uncharacterized protein LOC110976191 isoform X1 [Acanthaster planci]|uniref:Uncharacterized protein LOC110976191 isoform X1 n=1 Tax=Acanthaster planci TaxID=133434 RepID=A0A8B7XXI9_ACAPL|nr:uncharacterized protein LOC110976191 isoform X1 [Acanthaster planci]